MKKNLHKVTFLLILLALLLSTMSINHSAQVQTDTCQGSVSRINELQKQVEMDQQAIRNLHFDKNVTEAEEWEKLSEDAKQNLVSATLNMYVDNLLAAAPSAVKRIGSFNPAKANGFIGELQSIGVDDPYLFNAIRALGRARGKPAMAARANDVIAKVSKLKDTVRLINSDESGKTKTLQGIAMTLGWLTDNPKVAMVVSDVEAFTALAYSGASGLIAKDRINQLTELTEQDLNSLKNISALLETHVRDLRDAKQELSNCKHKNAFYACLDKCSKAMEQCRDEAWNLWQANKIGNSEMIRRSEACSAKYDPCRDACNKSK